VRFDLGGQWVPGQAQALNEGTGNHRPVSAWNCGNVCTERSGCAVELAQVFGARNAAQLAVEAVREHREFLTNGGWRCWLAVRAGQHWDGLVFARHALDLLNQSRCGWQPYLLDGALHHEGVGQVVDVFRRAAEVHELGHRRQVGVSAQHLWCRCDATLDVVLNCLDVVYGYALDFAELCDSFATKVRDDLAQVRLFCVGEGRGSRHNLAVGEGNEPLNFNVDAFAVERAFGQVVYQGSDGPAVASVQCAERDWWSEVSKTYACISVGHGSHSFTFATGHGIPVRVKRSPC